MWGLIPRNSLYFAHVIPRIVLPLDAKCSSGSAISSFHFSNVKGLHVIVNSMSLIAFPSRLKFSYAIFLYTD